MNNKDLSEAVLKAGENEILEIVSQNTTFPQCMNQLAQVHQSKAGHDMVNKISSEILEKAFSLANGVELIELLNRLSEADQPLAERVGHC